MNARLISVMACAFVLGLGLPAQGQISSVTRRTRQAPHAITITRTTPPANAAPATVVTAPPPPRVVYVPVPVVVHQKTEEERFAEQQRVVAFQKQLAEGGRASYQYELGMRYVEGNGVAKDPEAARKWLGLAAKQGHADAKKKLDELAKEPMAEAK